MMIFLRPKISARIPFVAAPITAPIKTELTRKPCNVSGRTQVSLINKSAPEITPVSYPDNKPPKDATIATM